MLLCGKLVSNIVTLKSIVELEIDEAVDFPWKKANEVQPVKPKAYLTLS